jgi:glutathione peroxidase
MKKICTLFFIYVFALGAEAQVSETFHDFNAVTILGDTISLSQYAGKKLLVVNTASYCGFTPQFAALQALDSIYSAYNFEVIGFPCDDFGGQDPHNDSTILGFCTGVYGVTFQMMSKIEIIQPDTAECYKWLQLQSRNGVANAPVTWNFNKFLVDENGHWIAHFPSATLPFDTAITNWITGASTTGIEETDNFGFSLMTNPFKDNVTLKINENINVENASINLFSSEGLLTGRIYKGILLPGTSITYNTQKLAAGVYVLKIQTGRNVYSKKLIKL